MAFETLNPRSRLPLYHQLYEMLVSRIRSGEWKPGEMIPPEYELIRRYEISRITVRKVLDLLTQEGLIIRQRGRGTFVARPQLEHSMTRIVSFTDDMRQRGFEPGTRVLYSGLVPASPSIAEALGVPEGEELAQLCRLRLADGEPMCIEESNLVHRYMPGILGHDFARSSLREVKQEKYGIRWGRAKQTIRAIAAPAEPAKLLEIKLRSPLLCFERVSFSQNDVPMEFLRVYYRADRYVIYNELLGGAG
jgi:GntR family transcriptional regulator